MTHNNSPGPSTAAERDYVEFMQRGDDFLKIELLRPARSWYQKALELNMESDEAKNRITQCNNLLAFENKVVGILCAIASVLLLGWFIVSL